MRIVEVDPYDESLVRACHEVEQASIEHDRPHGLSRSLSELSGALDASHGLSRTTLTAAVVDGWVVGSVELEVRLRDNAHLAELMIHVVPERRREGVGTRLHEVAVAAAADLGRTTLLSPVAVPAGGTQPGMAFALARGYESVHVEDRLELRLPARVDPMPIAPGYQVLTWSGGCPEEHAASYCLLRTQMEADVPVGEVAWEAATFDRARLRADEERVLATAGIVAAMALADSGEPAGYSWVTLPDGSTYVEQEDTLVMPAHRGRGLAHLLKVATLDSVMAAHRDRTLLTTYTDPDNTPMYNVNRRFGFRIVEHSHEMQRAL